jgi:hypothetical protein
VGASDCGGSAGLGLHQACRAGRSDQENVIGQLKSSINALRVPLYDLVSNGAYLICVALARNIKARSAVMMHRMTTGTGTSVWSSADSSTASRPSWTIERMRYG